MTALDDISLLSFSGLDGSYRGRLPYTALSWSDSINEDGSVSATLPLYADPDLLRPYGSVLAAVSGDRVLHAGYVTQAQRSGQSWLVSGGGGGTILEKRLVLNHRLASSWRDGYVLVDEENPAGDWPLALRGSYSDLVSGLLSETIKWGSLPIVPAPLEGGRHERSYCSYDLATVRQRIAEIGELEDGPEIRFDPEIGGGRLSFRQRTSPEIVDSRWRWNAEVPGSPVALGDMDADGSAMCSQCFAAGGKDEDRLLVARASSSRLTEAGWPVTQVADTSHSSVSELPTLQSYARAAVLVGDDQQRTWGLRVRADVPVAVGDWADVRTASGVLALKVTDVSGSAGSGVLTVQCRERG